MGGEDGANSVERVRRGQVARGGSDADDMRRLGLGLELGLRGEGVGGYGVGVGWVEDRREQVEFLAGTHRPDMVKVVKGMRAGQAVGVHCWRRRGVGEILARSRTARVRNSLLWMSLFELPCCSCYE